MKVIPNLFDNILILQMLHQKSCIYPADLWFYRVVNTNFFVAWEGLLNTER